MTSQLKHNLDYQTDGENDDIHLLDLLIVIARNTKLILACSAIAATVALVVSLLLPPVFTSTVKILPPQQQSGGVAAALGQLGGLAAAAGSISGIKNTNDLYVGFLQSRTVADHLIDRFHLKERYDAKTFDDARKDLEKVIKVDDGKKDGMITLSVEDKDPQFAADMANAFVEELSTLTQQLAVSDAAKRRLFFEKQLGKAKEQLADAEVAMRKSQEKTGMIQPEGQVKAIISSIAELKGAIAAKEVQIRSIQTFATAKNPELVRVEAEMRGLQAQLSKLEANQPQKKGDFMVSPGSIPEAGVEYIRRLRDVKYYETLFEMLAKQYELARIDEAKDSSIIQVLDKAVPAERKTKPKRILLIIGALAGGLFLGVLIAFIRDAYYRSLRRPDDFVRWRALANAYRKQGA